MPTNSHLKMTYSPSTGWSPPSLVSSPYINLHIGATALHYGQSCFEGLKAFAHSDGSVHIFRARENARRMQRSCDRSMMECPTEDAFVEACKAVVKDNMGYVPPYGSGGSLYLRPLLFGSGPRIGLQPSEEYTFLIMVIPVGNYYGAGLEPQNALTITDYDRAAPRGMGAVKVAGNYAADLLPNMLGKEKGYPIGLYLDAATQTSIEEFSTSNFAGIINSGRRYVTPRSPSVLPSITNKSLMDIATDMGMRVEERDVKLSELGAFDEVLACGTAVVLTPIGSIRVGEEVHRFGEEGKVGTTTMELYNRVRAIQYGEEEDKFGWLERVC